jgi:hypothetical protein
MKTNEQTHRSILQSIAHRVMLERGLLPDFSEEALSELEKIQIPEALNGEPFRDLTDLFGLRLIMMILSIWISLLWQKVCQETRLRSWLR